MKLGEFPNWTLGASSEVLICTSSEVCLTRNPCLSRVGRKSNRPPDFDILEGLLERGWPVHLRVVPPSLGTYPLILAPALLNQMRLSYRGRLLHLRSLDWTDLNFPQVPIPAPFEGNTGDFATFFSQHSLAPSTDNRRATNARLATSDGRRNRHGRSLLLLNTPASPVSTDADTTATFALSCARHPPPLSSATLLLAPTGMT